MFRIWKERKVYDNVFLRELEQLIGMLDKTIRRHLSTSLDRRVCSLSTVVFFLSLRTTLTETTFRDPSETAPRLQGVQKSCSDEALHTQVLIIHTAIITDHAFSCTALSAGRCDGGVAQV